MKSKQDIISEKLGPLIDACRPHLLNREPPPMPGLDKRARNALIILGDHFHELVRALLELRSAAEDVNITRKMCNRYPWRERSISRSQHLRLTWFQFENLCYLFHEKFSLYGGRLQKVMEFFTCTHRRDVKNGLKKIKGSLGKYIRNRGSSFHQWYETHQSVYHFTMIELLNTAGRAEGSFKDVKGHYSDAKFYLAIDIDKALEFMEDFLLEIIEQDLPVIVDCLTKFNVLVDRSSSNPSAVAKAVKVTPVTSKSGK